MSRIIWVGNVPPDLLTTTEAESFFSEYGSIISTKIHRDLVDATSYGFIFIEFSSILEAKNAVMRIKSQPPCGYNLECRMAISRGKPTTENDGDLTVIDGASRNVTYLGNLSQHTQEEDESDFILHSFSQRQKSRSKKR